MKGQFSRCLQKLKKVNLILKPLSSCSNIKEQDALSIITVQALVGKMSIN